MNPAPQSREPTAAPPGQSALPLGAARYSAVKLLVALGLLFVSAPFVQDLPHGDLVEAMLLTLVMVSAVLVVGSRRKVLILALVLLTPALAGKWINHFRPDLLHPAIFLAAAVAFFAFVIARLLAFIVRAPRVDANVLCAGVSGFLMLGLLWVPAYAAVARLNPHAFTLPARPDAPATLGWVQRLLLQRHHPLHRRLRRHRASFQGRPDARDDGSHHRAVLHGGADLAPGVCLFFHPGPDHAGGANDSAPRLSS